MADMVERVARALYAIRMEVAEGAKLPQYTWETDNNAYREHCLREARAAIEAMRPLPRELFVHSVRSYADERGNDYEDHADWWSDVIDAALNSSPPSQ